MVKITLEKEDMEKMIKKDYPGAEIVSGLKDDCEVVIKIESLPQLRQIQPPQEPPRNIIRDKRGNIDAKASGMQLPDRKETIPGGQMGRTRGRLPTF